MSNVAYFFPQGLKPSPTDNEVTSLQKITALLYQIANSPGGGGTGNVTVNGSNVLTSPTASDFYTANPPPGGYSAFSKKTTSFNASVGGIYGMDTTAGSITATPPSSPSDGDWFKVFDVAKKWGTNQAVIGSAAQNYIDYANPTATAGPYDLNAVPYSGQGFITFVWDAALSVWSVN